MKGKQKFSKEGTIIRTIAESKGITMAEIAKRTGANHGNNIRDKLLEGRSMRVEVLMQMCDALGVELCIMDGFKKYKLSEKEWNPDTDLILSRLASEQGEIGDKWLERSEKVKAYDRERRRIERETDREAYNEYHRIDLANRRRAKQLITEENICIGCDNYIAEIKMNGKGYCQVYDRYTLKAECEDFVRSDDNSPTEGEKMP